MRKVFAKQSFAQPDSDESGFTRLDLAQPDSDESGFTRLDLVQPDLKKSGFTLLELLIVMAVLAILVSVVTLIVKPQEIFAKARDAERKADLSNLVKAVEIYLLESTSTTLTANYAGISEGCLANNTPTLYYSSPSGSTNVADLPSGSGFTTIRLTNSNASDGTGWVAINFSAVASLNIGALPIDPSNSGNTARPGRYYTFACRKGNYYEFNANLEASPNDEANDGGNNVGLYEIGTDKTILPATSSTAFYQ